VSKVKVFLNKGETPLDADLSLLKAIELHSSGDIHVTESFDDPAMIEIAKKLETINKIVYANMIKEIIAALEDEYRGDTP
jgi:hypothetical protein